MRPEADSVPRDENKLVIWGASGHAKVVADIIRLQRKYEIVGFLDDWNSQLHGSAFCGARVLGGREQLEPLYRAGVRHIILGFGKCHARMALSELVKSLGFSLVTAIHPHATVAADVRVGAGTVIAAGTVINPGASIGENVIVNTLALVGHDCVVGDAAHISSGVRLAGGVTVGRAASVGIGSTVIERVRIGVGARIGAGSVVTKDIPEYVLAYGVPADIVRKMAPDEN
jgi:UDP-N-acetylbacillosamine N-acetyltransferase